MSEQDREDMGVPAASQPSLASPSGLSPASGSSRSGIANAGALLALAERVEAATGPDRTIDQDVFVLLGSAQWRDGFLYWMSGAGSTNDLVLGATPAYTASLDAAMTLVPEGWQIERLTFWTGDGSLVTLIETHLVKGEWVRERGWLGRVEGDAKTPALALTAAALRALASKEAGR